MLLLVGHFYRAGDNYQAMVAVSLAAPEIVTPQNNRIDVMIGEVTVRFIGPVDPQNARVVLDALR